ncbi:serine/threonine-protein kinase [Isoptericola variabilis]|nr:serine/threonine-protein kinase [Isoptericola variabilis]
MTVSDGALLGGRYRLEGLVGRGGMADVFEATDQALGRRVAVKVLRDVAQDPSDRDRFTAEARTLARLSHPSIVTVLDADADGDQPFLVLELVDGGSLAELEHRLASGAVARLGAQVAAALAHAHAAGVVHRDVKPANVLLGADGGALLTDFGIARLLADTVRHTRTGTTIGTAAYLAPEQVRGEAVGPPADVYSLGLVLLEALTGERAYAGSAVEAAVARLHAPPAVPEDLPAGWREILSAMTHDDAEVRPTAAQAAAALQQLTDADDAGWSPATATTAARTRDDVPTVASPPFVADADADADRRRRRAIPVGAAFAGAAAVATAVVLSVVGGGEPSVAETSEVVPGGVPPEMHQPLTELRDAIYEGTR